MGASSPHLSIIDMIEAKMVAGLAEAYLADSECYLVDVTVAPDNLIVVEIDHDQAVGIEDCVALSRYIEAGLDRDVEDYELEVTSTGLTSPFKTLRQYLKNIGNEVEVLLKSGEKLSGCLKSAEDTGFVVTVGRPVKPEGAKRKVTVCTDESYLYDEIKYTKNIFVIYFSYYLQYMIRKKETDVNKRSLNCWKNL